MSPHLQFLINCFICLVFSNFAHSQIVAGNTTTGKESIEPNKIFGDVNIVSDYVEKGMTYSEHKFAVQAALGYQWVYFKMGLWASNVAFEPVDDSFNIRLFFQYRFIWAQNSGLTMRYEFSRYYPSGSFNGNNIFMDFDYFTSYHVYVETQENYEVTNGPKNYFGFYKDWVLRQYLFWYAGGGYTQVKSSGYSNFFDARAGLVYKYKDLDSSLNIASNSTRGDFLVWLGFRGAF